MAVKKEKLEISFKGSVKLKKTSFLSVKPLDMSFKSHIELDENEASKIGTIRKQFQKIMEKNLNNQLAHMNTWLLEKDKYIAENLKAHKVMEKSRIPTSSTEIAAYAKQAQKLKEFADKLPTLDSELREIVDNWTKGAVEQQRIISMDQAIKAAQVKTYNDKVWRVRVGLAVKVVLVVAAIALSVAAIVLTAGAATPLVIGLAAAGATLAGISSITGVANEISKNANVEKKILSNVQSDIKKIADALKPMESGKTTLKKHVTELENLIRVRKQNSVVLQNEVKKKSVELTSYISALAKLPESKDKELKKKQVEKLKKSIVTVKMNVDKLASDIKTSEAVLEELKDLGVSLEKVSGQSANTVLGNLKERFSSIDGWTDLGNQVGGMTSGISGVV